MKTKALLFILLFSNYLFAETLTLQKGWNLVGTNSQLLLGEIKDQIGDENLLVVQGGGKTYKKTNPAFLNSFTIFENGSGYWIKVAINSSLEYTPSQISNTIQLKSGWNLIDPQVLSLEELKDQVGDENLLVVQGGGKTYKKTNPAFLNTFTGFEEPYGYWVKVQSSVSISFGVPNACKALPKTGQTTSYYTYDDGDYQKGVKRDYIRDDAKQIITHNSTGLVWQDDEAVKIVKKPWNEAVGYCNALTVGGFDDWRLPTIEELVYLVDKSKAGPSIDSIFKNVIDDYHWSSTESVDIGYSSNSSWRVHFHHGYDATNGKFAPFYIRCVRDKSSANAKVNFVRDSTKEIVTDNKTCLMWQDNEEAKTVTKTWQDAIDYCEDLNFAEYDDWRLPNFYELYSIADKSKARPAIEDAFLNIADEGFYRSSTSSAMYSGSTWCVYSGDGSGSDIFCGKSEENFVRCVRGEE